MAANLEKRDKQYGLEQAWHSMTEIVERITKEIAFPWQVILAEILYKVNGEMKNLKGYRLPLASDDMLPLGFAVPVNCTGENATYTLRTPQETWDFMARVLNGSEHTIVSAGTVQNRSKYFISAKLTELESVTLEDGSNMELILNGLGSLDKSLHESIVFSGIRTVCYNTLMLNFLQKENNWKYRHSKNMTAKVENDIPLIEKVVGFSAIVKATFDSMIAKPCTVDRAERIYTGFIVPETDKEISKRAQNMIAEHVDCFQTGDGNSGKTEFDLLNGWTQPRTRGYENSKRDSWDVFETAEFGTYARSKEAFAGLLLPKNRAELDKVENRGRELLAV